MKHSTFFLSMVFSAISLMTMAQNSFEVKKWGEGQPVLLLPGFACTPQVYDELISDLANSYEVHAFTFAGFGGVPPVSFPWLPQIKADIDRYVKDNNLKKPIIIGHSLGGTLGLWLAAESDVYSQLIVIDALPAMGALMIPGYNSENIVYDNPQNKQILEMDSAAFRQMAIHSASYMTANVEKQKLLAKWMVNCDRETYVYGYTDLLKLDLRDSLNKIQLPVHILAAALPYGKETAEANYRLQYQNLANYSLKFAENSGHFIMYDQPEWFMNEIKSLLEGNE